MQKSCVRLDRDSACVLAEFANLKSQTTMAVKIAQPKGGSTIEHSKRHFSPLGAVQALAV